METEASSPAIAAPTPGRELKEGESRRGQQRDRCPSRPLAALSWQGVRASARPFSRPHAPTVS